MIIHGGTFASPAKGSWNGGALHPRTWTRSMDRVSRISGGSILGITKQMWNAGVLLTRTLTAPSSQSGKPAPDRFWFEVSPIRRVWKVVAPGVTEYLRVLDRLIQRDTSETLGSDFIWSFTVQRGPTSTETITRSSSDLSIVRPDPTDESRWLFVSSGLVNLTLSCPSRTVTIQVYAGTQAGSVSTLLGYDPDSLRTAMCNAVDSRITGKTPATALRIFSTQNHTTGVYVRNTQCWTADVDLTPISPWNSSGANCRAGVLISPRHVMFAAHYQPDVGATFRFVTADNQLVTRAMTAKQTMPGYTSYYPDITIGVLDSDVPAGISFAKVLPDNYTSKLPTQLFRIPAICLDQEEKALVTDLSALGSGSGMYGAMASFVIPENVQRLAFHEDKIGGDSGNPACLILGTQLILLTVWTFGGAGSGTSVTYHKTAINTIMTALGGGYQLTEVDLSAYPTYT